MILSPEEKEWIRHRAEKIHEERGWPLPIAASEACAELTRGRASGHQAKILAFPETGSRMACTIIAPGLFLT